MMLVLVTKKGIKFMFFKIVMILEVKVEYKIGAYKHKIDLQVFQLPELMKL